MSVEPSALPGPPHKAPSRRLGVLRFQHQVNAIDDLLHDHDPQHVNDRPDDAYEGAAIEIMRALRDAESNDEDYADAIRSVVPQAAPDLIARIIAAWDEG